MSKKLTSGLLATMMMFVIAFSSISPAQAQGVTTQQAQLETLIETLRALIAQLSAQQEGNTNTNTVNNVEVVQDTHGSGLIKSISQSANPIVRGTATGLDTVGFSVGNGDKIYGSGKIKVDENGTWSHRISTDLADGEYKLTLYSYSDNVAIDQMYFVVCQNSPCPVKG